MELILIGYAINGENRIIRASEIKPKCIIAETTAYCPCELCCGIWADGFTFTGDKAGKGCIAIDPKNGILKMGQKVYIKGYGYGICNDIGGAIKGERRLDLCFDTHKEALEWGRKFIKVCIITEEQYRKGIENQKKE